jgi:hypothetical protein
MYNDLKPGDARQGNNNRTTFILAELGSEHKTEGTRQFHLHTRACQNNQPDRHSEPVTNAEKRALFKCVCIIDWHFGTMKYGFTLIQMPFILPIRRGYLTIILSCIYAIFILMLGVVVYIADLISRTAILAEVSYPLRKCIKLNDVRSLKFMW